MEYHQLNTKIKNWLNSCIFWYHFYLSFFHHSRELAFEKKAFAWKTQKSSRVWAQSLGCVESQSVLSRKANISFHWVSIKMSDTSFIWMFPAERSSTAGEHPAATNPSSVSSSSVSFSWTPGHTTKLLSIPSSHNPDNASIISVASSRTNFTFSADNWTTIPKLVLFFRESSSTASTSGTDSTTDSDLLRWCSVEINNEVGFNWFSGIALKGRGYHYFFYSAYFLLSCDIIRDIISVMISNVE